jgi:hypothetical protein
MPGSAHSRIRVPFVDGSSAAWIADRQGTYCRGAAGAERDGDSLLSRCAPTIPAQRGLSGWRLSAFPLRPNRAGDAPSANNLPRNHACRAAPIRVFVSHSWMALLQPGSPIAKARMVGAQRGVSGWQFYAFPLRPNHPGAAGAYRDGDSLHSRCAPTIPAQRGQSGAVVLCTLAAPLPYAGLIKYNPRVPAGVPHFPGGLAQI